MCHQTTYTRARTNLAALYDEVTANRKVVIILRRGAEDVALVAAEELDGLLETAHLLRSAANAKRLLTALWPVPNAPPVPRGLLMRCAGAQVLTNPRKKPYSDVSRARLCAILASSWLAALSVACRPCMRPRISPRDRFCPSFVLPSIRKTGISKHTIAFISAA